MVIGIDAGAANREKKTGVNWYSYNLINALHQMFVESPLESPLGKGGESVQVVLYLDAPPRDDILHWGNHFELKELSWSGKGWNTFRLSWEMWHNAPEVLFVPANKIPPAHPKHTVTTIHDIGPDRIPEMYQSQIRSRVKSATRQAVKRAGHILAVSDFTKQEVMDVYKVSNNKITATPLAADTTKFKPLEQAKVDRVLAKYRLGRSYFLHVGRLEAKKNIHTLLRAFEIFKSSRGVGDPYQLVLAGTPGYGYERYKKFIHLSEAKDSIVELGFVPDEDLPALMNGAYAYTFPSWYEGFGIPALETMACGTPLIASDIGALHETAGNAALFVSPREPEQWAGAMKKLAREPKIADELVNKGFEQVKKFSWKKTAEETWKVLTTVV